MLILLPPSETKSDGGIDGPLDLTSLSFPELVATRSDLVGRLADLAADVPASRAALGIARSLDHEIEWNARIHAAPTRPALDRYTGVLYDRLQLRTLTTLQRARADRRLIVASALFGAIRATDRIPPYRLSASSRLPGRPTLTSIWRPVLGPVLGALAGPVLDLRSGAYAALAPVPGAITVQVVTDNGRGGRSVVSHFSKAAKGDLARALCVTRADLESVTAILRAARAAGFVVERTGPVALTVVTP